MNEVELWCVGESIGLIDTTSIGPLSMTSGTRLSFGGAESNVAIAAARLGTRSGWVGVLGEDPFGRIVHDGIRSAGVAVVSRTSENARTGLMVKERRLAGRAGVTYYRNGSAGSLLQPSDVEPIPLRGPAIAHTTGITLAISSSARATIDRLAARVRETGSRLSFDINHRSSLINSADAAAAYLSVIRRSNIVFGGVDEFSLVLGGAASVSEITEAVLALGPEEVVVKLGSHGAAVGTTGGIWSVDAHSVEVVDTVGAGDAFVAGYLTCRLRGDEPADALRTANTCGALTCMVLGDWEGAPRMADLEMLEDADPVRR